MEKDQGPGEPSLPDRADTGDNSFDGAATHHRDATLSFHEDLSRFTGAAPIELFRRSSWRWRATLSSLETNIAHQTGIEHGVATRIRSSANTWSFAASSGASIDAARLAARLAMGGEGTESGRGPLWASGSSHPIWDVDPASDLPSAEKLENWARAAGAVAAGRNRDGLPRSIWVEVAVTIESLAATGGLAACRQRVRAWATLRVGDEVRTLAGRSLDRLDPSALVSRSFRAKSAKRKKSGARVAVRFVPGPAATLIAAIVPVLHGAGGATGIQVGPGWRLEDHPMDPDGLSGGSFDDAGFKTRRVILADGNRVVALLDGAGHQIRGSYRQPPASRFTNLLVGGRSGSELLVDLVVEWLRLHPLGPQRWLLEFRGTDPRTGESTCGWIDAGEPRRLVSRCVCAFGEAQRTAMGVTTPSLVFEGLTLA